MPLEGADTGQHCLWFQQELKWGLSWEVTHLLCTLCWYRKKLHFPCWHLKCFLPFFTRPAGKEPFHSRLGLCCPCFLLARPGKRQLQEYKFLLSKEVSTPNTCHGSSQRDGKLRSRQPAAQAWELHLFRGLLWIPVWSGAAYVIASCLSLPRLYINSGNTPGGS